MDSDKENPLGVFKFQIESVNSLKTDIQTLQELTAEVIEMSEYWLSERIKAIADINQLYHPNTSTDFCMASENLVAGATAVSSAIMATPTMSTTPLCVAASAILGGVAAGVQEAKIRQDTRILNKTRRLVEDDYLETCGLQKLVNDYLLQLEEVQISFYCFINSYYRKVDASVIPECLGYTSLLNFITQWLQEGLSDESLWDGFQRCAYTCRKIRHKLKSFQCTLGKGIDFKIEAEEMQPDIKNETIVRKLSGYFQKMIDFWSSEDLNTNDSLTYNHPDSLTYNNTKSITEAEGIQQFIVTAPPGSQDVTPDACLSNVDAGHEFVENPTQKWVKDILTILQSGIDEAKDIPQMLKGFA